MDGRTVTGDWAKAGAVPSASDSHGIAARTLKVLAFIMEKTPPFLDAVEGTNPIRVYCLGDHLPYARGGDPFATNFPGQSSTP